MSIKFYLQHKNGFNRNRKRLSHVYRAFKMTPEYVSLLKGNEKELKFCFIGRTHVITIKKIFKKNLTNKNKTTPQEFKKRKKTKNTKNKHQKKKEQKEKKKKKEKEENREKERAEERQ